MGLYRHAAQGCTCGVDDHWLGTPWDGLPAMPIVDENYPVTRKACIHWCGSCCNL